MPAPNELRFDGRVAIVTGAGRGMGYGHASLLAARGAIVIVNDYKQELADEAVQAITKTGGKAEAIVMDIAVPGNCRSIVKKTVEKYGRIDILINNAGIGQQQQFQNLTDDDFFKMMGVHFFAPWFLTQAAWPHMMKQKYGRVIMTSSGSLFGMANSAHYTSAKAGVHGLGTNLAVEGKPHGIHVNTLDVVAGTQLVTDTLPDGPVKTFMKENLPADAPANLMAWLCHEKCTETGRFMPVGGKGFGLHYFSSTPGVWTQSEDWMTPEWARDHFSQAVNMEKATVLDSAQTATVQIAKRAGVTSMGDLNKAMEM